MASTKVANIVVPEVFNPYVIERTAELSALFSSGIIVPNPELDRLARSGGQVVNMPFWTDITGDDEVLDDSSPLSVNNLSTGTDKAVLLARGKAWGANDLAAALAGDDPMAALGTLVGAYWARRLQAILLKILEGACGAASMTNSVYDISSEDGTDAVLSAEHFLDAAQLLGDSRDKLTAVMMHSAAVTHLAKLDLIDYIPDSEGKATIRSFLGRTVVEDDGCPNSDGVYTSYIFGTGAIGYGEGAPPVPTETDRDSLAGDDILINRKHFLLHPRGVAWTAASIAGTSPTNAELATTGNWTRVYETKNIRIVQFKYRLAAAAGS